MIHPIFDLSRTMVCICENQHLSFFFFFLLLSFTRQTKSTIQCAYTSVCEISYIKTGVKIIVNKKTERQLNNIKILIIRRQYYHIVRIKTRSKKKTFERINCIEYVSQL
jgi:hypothetical protein